MSLNSTYARKSPFLLKNIYIFVFLTMEKVQKKFFVPDCATLQSCKTQTVKKFFVLIILLNLKARL